MVFLGPVWIAAVVLAVAGAGKLIRPAAAQPALRALALPSTHLAVRIVGTGELLVAAMVFLVAGPRASLLLAAVYAALAGAALRLWSSRRATGSGAGCGCFGASSAPVGWTHVLLNVSAVIAALGAAATDLDPLDTVWPRLPSAGFAHAVLVATGAIAAIAAMTVLPEVRLAARPAPARDPGVHLFGPTISRRPTFPPASPAASSDGSPSGSRSGSPAAPSTGSTDALDGAAPRDGRRREARR